MQKKGWIRQTDEQSMDRKIEYIITDEGREYFEKEISRLEELLSNARKLKEA